MYLIIATTAIIICVIKSYNIIFTSEGSQTASVKPISLSFPLHTTTKTTKCGVSVGLGWVFLFAWVFFFFASSIELPAKTSEGIFIL